jgi:hypothetical protein
MPNKVDDFIPFRLLQFIEARLKSIDTAMGYNSDPFVTDDWHLAESSTAKQVLFFETPGIEMDDQGVGDGKTVQPAMTIDVIGVCTYETERPRRLAMALEQDVRVAIHSALGDIRDSVGRGCSMTYGSCVYDGGVLAPIKEAGFRLSLIFTWSQRSGW